MAARLLLSKSLLRPSTLYHTPTKSPPLIPLHLHNRHHSSKPQLIEINLSSSSSPLSSESDGGAGQGEEDASVMRRKLEEIFHRVMLQKSTPDWLPFRPGSSFWVPPMINVTGLLHKFVGEGLDEDEKLSLSTDRGWPSSSYFLKDLTPTTVEMKEEGEEEQAIVRVELPEEVGGKVEVHVFKGPTTINVEVKEEEEEVDVKVHPKELDELDREVVGQGDEVEGDVAVQFLGDSSLEDKEK